MNIAPALLYVQIAHGVYAGFRVAEAFVQTVREGIERQVSALPRKETT